MCEGLACSCPSCSCCAVQVQAGNARFNAMQERPLASESPLGSFVGTPSEETKAMAAEQLQQRQQAPPQVHHPSVSPFTHASQQQRQPSSDLSEDDGPGDLEVGLQGRSRAGHGLLPVARNAYHWYHVRGMLMAACRNICSLVLLLSPHGKHGG